MHTFDLLQCMHAYSTCGSGLHDSYHGRLPVTTTTLNYGQTITVYQGRSPWDYLNLVIATTHGLDCLQLVPLICMTSRMIQNLMMHVSSLQETVHGGNGRDNINIIN